MVANTQDDLDLNPSIKNQDGLDDINFTDWKK